MKGTMVWAHSFLLVQNFSYNSKQLTLGLVLMSRYSLDKTFGVFQCGGSKVLSDTNQTDSIYLHNLIIYSYSVVKKKKIIIGLLFKIFLHSHREGHMKISNTMPLSPPPLPTEL